MTSGIGVWEPRLAAREEDQGINQIGIVVFRALDEAASKRLLMLTLLPLDTFLFPTVTSQFRPVRARSRGSKPAERGVAL